MTILLRSAGGLGDVRVHFNDGEFSSGLITWFDGRRCLVVIRKSVEWRRRGPLHVQCRRKKFAFAISSPGEFLVTNGRPRIIRKLDVECNISENAEC